MEVRELTEKDAGNTGRTGKAGRRQVRIPGFISDEDLGLGDAVTRATRRVGIRPCGGCARRAEAMNRWLTLSPGKRRGGRSRP
jgi:hypothetical protein